MDLSGIGITEVVERIKYHLQSDKATSSELQASIELFLMVVLWLVQRLEFHSNNSSFPQYKDSNRKKVPSKPSNKKRVVN